MLRRVVVTGLGLISPLGDEVEVVWKRIINGESGISRITKFDPGLFSSQIAGEVPEFDAGQWVEPREAQFMSNFVAYGTAAAWKALHDSRLLDSGLSGEQIGVNVSSGMGGFEMISRQTSVLLSKSPRHIPALFIPFVLNDSVGNYISIRFQFTGPNYSAVSACATGANAIGEAARLIQHGRVTAMVAGGAESPICELTMAGFGTMRALSTCNEEPQKASRPFDKKRNGFVIAEGAAVLILEEFEHARARGAHIYAELVGYGTNADGYHITQPVADGAGAANCMQEALKAAGISPREIGYINAHGTSTIVNDRTETLAIKRLWGEEAKCIPVSSTKSMTGHMLGAAGAIEAIFSILALERGQLPPTINYEYRDPECDLDYIPNQARLAQPAYALSNSFGFGGHNTSLVFKRYQS